MASVSRRYFFRDRRGKYRLFALTTGATLLLSSVIVQEERFQQDEKVRRETRRIQALSMGKASQSGL